MAHFHTHSRGEFVGNASGAVSGEVLCIDDGSQKGKRVEGAICGRGGRFDGTTQPSTPFVPHEGPAPIWESAELAVLLQWALPKRGGEGQRTQRSVFFGAEGVGGEPIQPLTLSEGGKCGFFREVVNLNPAGYRGGHVLHEGDTWVRRIGGFGDFGVGHDGLPILNPNDYLLSAGYMRAS